MGAFAPFTVLNGEDLQDPAVSPTTDRDFTPHSIDANGVAKWYNVSSEVLDARESVSLSVRLPQKGSQVARVQLKYVLPIMDSVDSTLKKGEAICNVEFVIPKTMTEAQRVRLLTALSMPYVDPVDTGATPDIYNGPLAKAVRDLEMVY
jgi:hypothetical protein